MASRRSVSLLVVGAFWLAPRWRVSADCLRGNQRSHASTFEDSLIWANSQGGASDVMDIWPFTDTSDLRSSIGQLAPPIGQLEGFEGCLEKERWHSYVLRKPSNPSRWRSASPGLVRSVTSTERCDDSRSRVTRVATDHVPMLDPDARRGDSDQRRA